MQEKDESLCTLISEMTDLEFKRRLTNHLIFSYAREILRLCRTINHKRCKECQYNDPSQLHHDCFTMTDSEVSFRGSFTERSI